MEILIAGGSGFIGRALVQYLLEQNLQYGTNYQLTILGRNKLHLARLLKAFESVNSKYSQYLNFITWRELEYSPENIVHTVAKFDCIINLCGQNIGQKRWSESYKQQVLSSRINPTKKLAQACVDANKLYNKSITLYNASAIGIYGLQNASQIYNEDSSLLQEPQDFLAKVGKKWEESASVAIENDVRVVFMRFAVVLDWSGGVLKQMALPFKLGLGGRVGSGEQAFTWIALADLVRAIVALINNHEVSGPVNLVAPKPTKQILFAEALAKYLHRPCLLPLPSFVVKLIFGQMGEELLLSGQMVESNRLDKYYQDWIYSSIAEYFK